MTQHRLISEAVKFFTRMYDKMRLKHVNLFFEIKKKHGKKKDHLSVVDPQLATRHPQYYQLQDFAIGYRMLYRRYHEHLCWKTKRSFSSFDFLFRVELNIFTYKKYMISKEVLNFKINLKNSV